MEAITAALIIKPVCKMGFGPAEEQILKLQMISAKDSQKEGQA